MAQPGFGGAAAGYGGDYSYAAASALAAAQQAAAMQHMAAYGGMPGGMQAVGFGVAVPMAGHMPMSPVAGSPTAYQYPGGASGGGRQPPMPPPSPSARYGHQG